MTANLASGPLNLVNELVFVRLYMQSDNAVTLKYARGTMNGETYRPSDDLESLMYEYRIWLYENNPRELVLKEIPGLYPIPSLTAKLAEFLGIVYRYTRFGEVDRESWMKLMAKCAGGLSLVDSDLALTVEEARMVSKYDVWSGSLESSEHDVPERVDIAYDIWSMQRVKVDDAESDIVVIQTQLGPQEVSKKAMCFTLRELSQRTTYDCKRALAACAWDISKALKWLEKE